MDQDERRAARLDDEYRTRKPTHEERVKSAIHRGLDRLYPRRTYPRKDGQVKVAFGSSRFTTVGRVPEFSTDSAIEAEPMLFSASPDFAYEKGGTLTRSVLDMLWNFHNGPILPGYHWVIDSRSHMLMPGMIPAIPGWHCDGVIRPKGGNGQPDLTLMNPRVRHFTCHIGSNAGVSKTEFFLGPVEVEIDPEKVWESLHTGLEVEVMAGRQTQKSLHGDVVMFGQDTPHRATPSPARGWRWWFRMSEYDKPPMNKIRHQVQVYASEGGGW